jgi:hypothetical protein
MTDLTAYAVKKSKSIEITIFGSLPNSCYQARIDDIYPGGKIMYVVDPNAAQVFIEETKKAGNEICSMNLVPWAATVNIPDQKHEKVEIFINHHEELKIPVLEIKNTSVFIVIAFTASIPNKPRGCSIIPENAMYPAIYSKVFGPNPYDLCQNWVAENCILKLSEVTIRVKNVIRNWAKMPDDMKLVLDDKLSSLRSNAQEELRAAINAEFKDEKNMPISKTDWDKKDPKTVRDVRDLIDSYINK